MCVVCLCRTSDFLVFRKNRYNIINFMPDNFIQGNSQRMRLWRRLNRINSVVFPTFMVPCGSNLYFLRSRQKHKLNLLIVKFKDFQIVIKVSSFMSNHVYIWLCTHQIHYLTMHIWLCTHQIHYLTMHIWLCTHQTYYFFINMIMILKICLSLKYEYYLILRVKNI